jgi:hypothetical protein
MRSPTNLEASDTFVTEVFRKTYEKMLAKLGSEEITRLRKGIGYWL